MNFFERFMFRILKAHTYLSAGYDYDLNHQIKKRVLEETLQFIDKNIPKSALCFSPSPKEQLLDYALSQITQKGDILEFGVRAGESITHIANKLRDTTIHGFDSFVGLPEDWAGHAFLKHDFTQDGKMPTVPKNVILHKGWFEKTIPEYNKNNDNDIAFINLDCDIYSSTKTVFDELGNKIKKGTIILIDDFFNYRNWQQHQYKAFQEFVENNNVKFEYIAFNGKQGVCIRIN